VLQSVAVCCSVLQYVAVKIAYPSCKDMKSPILEKNGSPAVGEKSFKMFVGWHAASSS